MPRIAAGLVMVVMAGFLPISAVRAADDLQDDATKLWNVDQIMDQAARNIATRYNLNAHQTEYTRTLLVEEVTKFLREHEEIWPLVRDLTRYQIKGERPSGEVASRLAEKAMPLLKDIEDTIYEANERWRNILSPQQREMHDYDLQDMVQTFGKMRDNFEAMKRGEAREARVFPAPNPRRNQPPRPPRPPRDFDPTTTAPSPIVREVAKEDAWDQYVAKFIKDYSLDDAQSEAAWSILRECKRRARDYRNAKRERYAEVQRGLEDASRGQQSAKARETKMRSWRLIEKSLNKPIMDLYLELQDRLDKIPSDAQRLRVEGKAAVARRNADERKGDGEAKKDEQAAKDAEPQAAAGTQPEKPPAEKAPAAKSEPKSKTETAKKAPDSEKPSPTPEPAAPE